MNVLQLKKQLTGRAQIPKVAEVRVRNFSGPRDIPVWADLITAAFAAARPPVRRWSPAECERRILQQPWWKAQRMWFTETNEDSQVVGTVTLGFRVGRNGSFPTIQWLAVLPGWRRLGVARLLMAHLERSCWDAGFRQIHLETHRDWREAGEFYQSLGYRMICRPAMRTSPA